MSTIADCPDESTCPGIQHEWTPEPTVIHKPRTCLRGLFRDKPSWAGLFGIAPDWDGGRCPCRPDECLNAGGPGCHFGTVDRDCACPMPNPDCIHPTCPRDMLSVEGPRLLNAHAPWCNLADDHGGECGHMNDQRYNAVPNLAYLPETHWCNYCAAMTDHLSSGHPGDKPAWTIVDSHMCTRCGFLDRTRDGIMAHLATCGAGE